MITYMTLTGRSEWELVGPLVLTYLLAGAYWLLFIVASLCQKYKKAKATVETMNSAVEEPTKSIGNSHWISEWKRLEETARTERGESLMIYNVTHTPGMFINSGIIFPHSYVINSSITSQKTTGSHERQ